MLKTQRLYGLASEAHGLASEANGLASEANGRGRGGGTGMFNTPSSWEEAGRPMTYGPLGSHQHNGLQSQGEMPREPVMGPGPQTMGAVKPPEQQECSGADELQRALEGEMVDFLRQQNSQLMKEIADLKAAAATSPWSTVRGGSVWGMVLGRLSVLQKDG